MARPRVVPLEGAFNFRDLGGYPTDDGRRLGWGHLFRSDGLHHLTANDVCHLREAVGLATIIDLRSTHELRSDGRGLLEAQPIRFHHIPLFDGEAREWRTAEPLSLADRYFLMAEYAKDKVGRVLAILCEAPGPAVYHCAAGKDRTGVISAVLLGVLGVPDEVIVADYAATKENLDAIVERLMNTRGYEQMLAALPPDTLHAEPETMIGLLAGIRDRYGSMREYAAAAGVDTDAIDRLAARVLEPGLV